MVIAYRDRIPRVSHYVFVRRFMYYAWNSIFTFINQLDRDGREPLELITGIRRSVRH